MKYDKKVKVKLKYVNQGKLFRAYRCLIVSFTRKWYINCIFFCKLF